jgi:hypothetical protein
MSQEEAFIYSLDSITYNGPSCKNNEQTLLSDP